MWVTTFLKTSNYVKISSVSTFLTSPFPSTESAPAPTLPMMEGEEDPSSSFRLAEALCRKSPEEEEAVQAAREEFS